MNNNARLYRMRYASQIIRDYKTLYFRRTEKNPFSSYSIKTKTDEKTKSTIYIIPFSSGKWDEAYYTGDKDKALALFEESNFSVALDYLKNTPAKWETDNVTPLLSKKDRELAKEKGKEDINTVWAPTGKEMAVLVFLMKKEKNPDDAANYTPDELAYLSQIFNKLDTFFTESWSEELEEEGITARSNMLFSFITNFDKIMQSDELPQYETFKPKYYLTVTSEDDKLYNSFLSIPGIAQKYATGIFMLKNGRQQFIEDNLAGTLFNVLIAVLKENSKDLPGKRPSSTFTRRINLLELLKKIGYKRELKYMKEQGLTKEEYNKMLIEQIDSMYAAPDQIFNDYLSQGNKADRSKGIKIFVVKQIFENGDVLLEFPYFQAVLGLLRAESKKLDGRPNTSQIISMTSKPSPIEKDICDVIIRGLVHRGKDKKATETHYDISYRNILARLPVLRDKLAQQNQNKYKTRIFKRIMNHVKTILEDDCGKKYKNFTIKLDPITHKDDIDPAAPNTGDKKHCVRITHKGNINT